MKNNVKNEKYLIINIFIYDNIIIFFVKIYKKNKY